ncbi:large-conductance mechanosensitive channel protein MscL [Candidatus Saccharibacteria bacterium]|nr:large-conductance mechanosensitive channel protein MscL [Candidatus Saccharibacteria bacterium]
MEKATDKLKKITKKEHPILKEFKEFINRGSVVDLAVGMVVGAAFTAIVTSLVNDVVMPVISMIIGGFDFTNLQVTIPAYVDGIEPATIKYGNFIQAAINFLVIAFVIFMMVRIINKLNRKKSDKPQEVVDKTAEKQEDEQIVILREIRDSLKKKK